MSLTFWDFVCERHSIYLKRQAGAPPPWTTDSVLANYHFTNVYRELDPGTVFIREQLNRNGDASIEERVFNVAMYRLCLHERSFAEIGWVKFPFDGPAWAARVKAVDKPFHGAYYIHNMQLRIPKADAMAIIGGHAYRHLVAVGVEAGSRQEFIASIASIKGLGIFLATQTLADMCYDQHVPLPEEGWVGLGYGALKGLSLLAGTQVEGAEAEAVLEELWASQPDVGGPRLTRMNVQNCCCEFSKYNGHPRRRFSAEGRVAAQQEFLL